ncbi:MAG: hypothetical protein ABIU87_13940 [Ornithinibacter sp.]
MSDTYLVSGVLLAVAGVVLGGLNAATLTAFGVVISFFTSSGASAAYLTARRGLPVGDPGPVHRVRLRGRHRHGWHQRAAARRRHRRR